jgi:hypothetical protein
VPEGGIEEFLDTRVRVLRMEVIHKRRSARYRQLTGDMLYALHSEKILALFVSYIESPSPNENYQGVIRAIRGAWRKREEFEDEVEEDEVEEDRVEEDRVEEDRVEEDRVEEDRVEEDKVQVVDPIGPDPAGSGSVQDKLLNARAYYIGAELYHELLGKEQEFVKLSMNLIRLRKFIGEQFDVHQVPRKFDEWKGYSYKTGLTQKAAIRGQLRPPLRQIRDHPEIFGSAVSERARVILDNIPK